MPGDDRSRRQAWALRAHLQALADLEGIDATGRVRLVAALLADAMVGGRVAGVDHRSLERLVREGEEMALDVFGRGPDEAGGPLSRLLSSASAPAPSDATSSARPSAPAVLVLDPPEGSTSSEAGPEAPVPASVAEALPGDLLFDDLFATLAQDDADAAPASGQADEPIPDLPLEALIPLGADGGGFDQVPTTSEVDLALLLRRHTRFETRDKVVVQLAGRDELRALYTRDISKGGLFVTTDDPPPIGSQLRVTLETPDGTMVLSGRVVHVMTPAQVQASGADPGVGVQFDDLDRKTTQLLERYIEGLAQRLDGAAASGPDLSGPLEIARKLMRHVEASELYLAVDRPPTASDDELRVRIEELRGIFGRAEETADEAERARFTGALRMLDRLGRVFADRTRRLAYDFQHGHERVEARYAEAAGDQARLNELRGVWRKVREESMRRANSLAAEALGAEKARDYATAARKAEEAIAHDPFYPPLRERAASWTLLRDAVATVRGADRSPEEWVALALDNGLSSELMRKLWASEHPDRMAKAKESGRRAVQAETLKRLDLAVQAARDALQNDPFNDALRETLLRWEMSLEDG